MELYEKKGYLNHNFKLFHLTEVSKQEFEYHYHEFDKIIIFISGKVMYQIEGKSYPLEPYDIVFVNHNDIHKPNIDNKTIYERIIVYISPEFMKTYQKREYDLTYCFQKAKEECTNVLRIPSVKESALFDCVMRLEESFMEESIQQKKKKSVYANELYQQILFLEFMIHLNRAAIMNHLEYRDTNIKNQKIVDMIQYINHNLTEEIRIDTLSELFYISKYHMMRQFKEETGYTIGNYISCKRLAIAKSQIEKGIPITQACYDCGFRDYSTFSRAYKKLYGVSPKRR